MSEGPRQLLPTGVNRVLPILGVSRTRVVRFVTRLPHARLVGLMRAGRRHRALRVAAAPLAWWLNRGHIALSGGLGVGLRMWKADIPFDHAHAGIIVRGQVEVPVQEALRRHLGPGDILYDVGSNLGFFALIGARLVGDSGAVYAFEPVPGNAEAIRRNAASNDFGWVTVLERAAWSESGRGAVLVPGDTSWSHLEATGRHPDTQATIDVEQVALDDLVARGEARPPTVVKIDTEGAEIGVLEGMRAILAEHRPVVICELHGTNERFAALMGEHGYRLENLDGTEPVAGGPPNLHALAVPGDRTG